MKLLYVKFFQPVVVSLGNGTSVVTSATNKDHDLVLLPKTNLIKITHKASNTSTYSSLFNMAWMREDESNTETAKSPKGTSET